LIVGQADNYDRRVDLPTFVWYFSKQSGFSTGYFRFELFPVATGMEEHRLNALDFFRGTNGFVKIYLMHILVEK
jgi:5-methyltetrahydrofolate--homocysteine methyltransferase